MTAKNAGIPLATIVFAAGCFMTAQGAAPAVKTQPGFYRLTIGDFEVTALNDGVIPYQTARVLPTATPKQVEEGLSQAGLTDPVGMSYNAFLINTGSKLVLIDTGTGGKLDDEPEFHGAGRLMANLRAAGYRPDQVDEIYITHRGQDHIGGLTLGKERAFPNAQVRAPKKEFDMFLDPEKTAALLAKTNNDPRAAAWIQFTQDLFEPYIEAGKFESFDEDMTLIPGIRALGTPGHTPGHTAYIVESQGQTLIVMGDLVLMGAMQFTDPTLPSSFDADRNAAIAQRQRILQMAADGDYWIAGAHLSFPGLGHVRTHENRYRWTPVNYAIP